MVGDVRTLPRIADGLPRPPCSFAYVGSAPVMVLAVPPLRRMAVAAAAAAVFFAAFFAAAPVTAATLDFTDASTSTAGGTFLGRAYTVSASNGVSDMQAFDGIMCPAPLACDRDGIGSGRDDEIGGRSDRVTISFDSPLRITGLHLLDLFVGVAAEIAAWSADGGPIATASALGANAALGGYRFVALDGAPVSAITFSAPLAQGDDFTNDFALAAIEAVPIPGSLLLLMSAVAGVILLGWRGRAAV